MLNKSLQTILLRFYVLQVLLSVACSFCGVLLFAVTNLTTQHLDTWFVMIYISLMIALGFAALSLSLFLNVIDFIRNRFLLSATVWMTLPVLLLIYVIYLVPELVGLIAIIPYMVGLIIAFWKFRNRMANPSKRLRLEIVTKETRKILYGNNSDGMPPGGDWA